jgi:G:T-mismatch repair DNA endonuclease (very short patch repair protein)
LAVRSLLHRLGYRFRLGVHGLPGRPDLVLPRYRTVLYVRNDAQNQGHADDELRRRGWQVMVVGTSELQEPEILAVRLDYELRCRLEPGARGSLDLLAGARRPRADGSGSTV